jgi:hypothetical protein
LRDFFGLRTVKVQLKIIEVDFIVMAVDLLLQLDERSG